MPGTQFNFSNVAVMIVDDNRHMRELLFSILRALGFRKITEQSDGEAAMREIDQFAPDIVITDWHMEPMDGMELVRRIRNSAEETTRYVPIIMLTGHSEAERVRAARDAGVHEFLAKPISAKSLLARIVRIVDHPRPFIRTDEYFGPDRRRQNLGPPEGIEERRQNGSGHADASPRLAAGGGRA